MYRDGDEHRNERNEHRDEHWDEHWDDEHWTVWAACRGVDPELFYPVSTAGPAVLQVAEAKAICARCLVQSDCLVWALRAGEPAGIWGGTTPEERRYLRREVGARR